MKTNVWIACLLALACCFGACNDEDNPHPRTTLLGEKTLTGTIVLLPNPPSVTGEPTLPGLVLGLETASGDYILTRNGHWESAETITIDGAVYSSGDTAEVTGAASETQLSATEKYLELEIKTIRKLGVEDYPKTVPLGEQTLSGTIVLLPNPPSVTGEPTLPGLVLGLETASGNYLLTRNGQWETAETITIEGDVYSSGDKAEVTGAASETQLSATEKYLELEIKTIRKLGVEDYPKTVPLGEQTLSGTIVLLPNPPSVTGEPTLPGLVLGLETASGDYLLTRNGHWEASETITIDGVTYSSSSEDRAEVTGAASETQLSATEKYYELEIERIKKI